MKHGKRTSFQQSAKLKADEMVVCSKIVYSSRRHCDSANTNANTNAKVMATPRMTSMASQMMPFDGKRMFWGGFKSLVELQLFRLQNICALK